MSGAPDAEEPVRSAVPIPDLTPIDVALHGDDRAALRTAVKQFRPADLGRDLSRRPLAEARAILDAIDDRRGAAMLRATHPVVAAQLLAATQAPRSCHLLEFIPTDHEVAILGELPPARRAEIERAYTPEEKAQIDRLLAYPESAIGRIMTPKIWRCDRGGTVGDAMDILRDHAEDIEVAVNCYLCDGKKLVGVAPLRELATADRKTPLAQIMTPDPIAVGEETARGDAADIINTHDFLSLP